MARMLWIGPQAFTSGEPSLTLERDNTLHNYTKVTTTTTGDAWVAMALRLPALAVVKEIHLQYVLDSTCNFISQTRLADSTDAVTHLVVYDDATDLLSTKPTTYESAVPDKSFGYAAMLKLRLTFRNTTHAINLGAVGIKFSVPEQFNVSTLSDLQALQAGGFDSVHVRGRTSEGDGGEGLFRWDSSDFSSATGDSSVPDDEVATGEGDGGIYVAPASDKTGASGAWVRQDVTALFPKWYGIPRGCGRNDKAGFDVLWSQASALGLPVVLPKYADDYVYNGVGTIPTGLTMVAEGLTKPIIKTTEAVSNWLSVADGASDIYLRGIVFDGNAQVTSRCFTNAGNCSRLVVEYCEFVNTGDDIVGQFSKHGVYFDNGDDLTFRECVSKNWSRPFRFGNQCENVRLLHNIADTYNKHGIYIVGGANRPRGFWLIDNTVQNPTTEERAPGKATASPIRVDGLRSRDIANGIRDVICRNNTILGGDSAHESTPITGTTTATGGTVMTDSEGSFEPDALIGSTIENVTRDPGRSYTIIDNDKTTVTTSADLAWCCGNDYKITVINNSTGDQIVFAGVLGGEMVGNHSINGGEFGMTVSWGCENVAVGHNHVRRSNSGAYNVGVQLDVWVTPKHYREGDFVFNGERDFRCIQCHTSSSTNEPGSGVSWEDYWCEVRARNRNITVIGNRGEDCGLQRLRRSAVGIYLVRFQNTVSGRIVGNGGYDSQAPPATDSTGRYKTLQSAIRVTPSSRDVEIFGNDMEWEDSSFQAALYDDSGPVVVDDVDFDNDGVDERCVDYFGTCPIGTIRRAKSSERATPFTSHHAEQETFFVKHDTQSDTALNAFVYTVPTHHVVAIRAEILGAEEGSGSCCKYTIEGLFRRQASRLRQIGSTSVITSIETNTSLDAGFDIPLSAPDVRIQVKGLLNTNMDWSLDITITKFRGTAP